ncbi:MAG: flagellar biosynthesis protein FlhA [Bacteroidetes bacterium]|nr:flagellar biosynthesis protein FlhA [Bacteroidota bacterium]MCW5895097.1 flagellar biosynthesis protein FlhA [Bacteroidota bacterium]
MKMLSKNSDFVLAGGVILILAMMIIPLPPLMLDVLLATNITIAILILTVSMYITHPLELSVFPGLLLILTIFRLSLNVASTRLILGEGYAGEVINAFGIFVVQGNYVVGFIIFIILVIIQFIVIVKGAGRIAEVAARFTLDAMPGKQMAIDADMNAGLITEDQARQRRREIAREAEFHGAMDGASKFVKGDAIAGLLINLVNIVGGFVIGIVQRGMPFTDALQNYTLLTVGDGLVSQIPALIVSTAAGMIVTRSASGTALDIEMRTQLLGKPKPLLIVSGALGLFAIVPGLPTIPFLLLAGLTGSIGFVNMRDSKHAALEKAKPPAPATPKQEQIEDYLQVDPLEVEIGYGLISLVDEIQGGDLFNRITNLRKQLAMDLGIIIPPVRVRDNLQLDPNQYVIKIRGNVVVTNTLMVDRLLAMNPGVAGEDIKGIAAKEPAFGLPAIWIGSHERDHAEMAGYTVVEPAAVLSTHLQEVLRRNCDKILGRQETKKLIENLKKEYPAIVDEINPESLPFGTIQKVLQNLLKEGIPVRDLVTILESLCDYAKVTKNVDVLTEYVRHSLSDTIARMYKDGKGVLHAIAMDPRLEQVITNALQNQRESSPSLGLAPEMIQEIQRSLTANVEIMMAGGYQPVVLCVATVRPYFYRLIRTSFPNVAVLSFTELPPETEIEFIGKLEASNAD